MLISVVLSVQAHDRLAATERECLSKLASLESELLAIRAEREKLLEGREHAERELNTLRHAVSKHQQESQNRQSLLENKIHELETLTRTLPRPDSEFWQQPSAILVLLSVLMREGKRHATGMIFFSEVSRAS